MRAQQKITRATKKTGSRRKVKRDDGLVRILRVELKLDLTPSGAQSLRSSLEGALKAASSSSWTAQTYVPASELNGIYLYLGPRETKQIVARLAEIAP
jgi:hypothetical protein